jgi:hypothetical protein
MSYAFFIIAKIGSIMGWLTMQVKDLWLKRKSKKNILGARQTSKILQVT